MSSFEKFIRIIMIELLIKTQGGLIIVRPIRRVEKLSADSVF
jgi:hypothetical protein